MATRRSNRWTLQDAKAQFSEVVRRSLQAGPQLVTRNGEDAVIVLAVREYGRLASRRNALPFAQFLAKSPLAKINLDIARPQGTGRAVRL